MPKGTPLETVLKRRMLSAVRFPDVPEVRLWVSVLAQAIILKDREFCSDPKAHSDICFAVGIDPDYYRRLCEKAWEYRRIREHRCH